MVETTYVILAGWGAIYAGALAREFWRRQYVRGAVGSLILSVVTVVSAGLVIWQRLR